MAGLEQHLTTLPAELYDYIFRLSFSANSAIRIITPAYRPPAILQVSQATRHNVAQEYYCQESIFLFNNHEVCLKWLLSLPADHIRMLGHVRCESASSSIYLDYFNSAARLQRLHIVRELHKRGIELDTGILYFREFREGGVKHWTNSP